MLSNFGLPSACVVSPCSSVCTSFVSGGVEHLIMCSMAIHRASFMKGLFFYWLFFFLLLICGNSLCILAMSFLGSLPFNFLSDISVNKLI